MPANPKPCGFLKIKRYVHRLSRRFVWEMKASGCGLLHQNKTIVHYGFRWLINDWFRSYLQERAQVTVVENSLSNKSLICWVPQGSVLGALLFLQLKEIGILFIYTNILHSHKDHKTLEKEMNVELHKGSRDQWIHLIHKWRPTWDERVGKHGIEAFWDKHNKIIKGNKWNFVCSRFGKWYSWFLCKWKKSIGAEKRRVTFLA